MWAEIKEENWGYEKKKMWDFIFSDVSSRRDNREMSEEGKKLSKKCKFIFDLTSWKIYVRYAYRKYWNSLEFMQTDDVRSCESCKIHSSIFGVFDIDFFCVIILLLKIWNLLAVAEDRIECCALSCEFVSRFRLGWYKRLLVLHTVKLRNYTHSIVPELCSMTKHTPDLINLFFSLRIQNIMCVRWR